jgi:hypothetical protein
MVWLAGWPVEEENDAPLVELESEEEEVMDAASDPVDEDDGLCMADGRGWDELEGSESADPPEQVEQYDTP